MKIPADMASFVKNGSNKENQFNFIETAFTQDKVKLRSKTMFFSNTNHCSKITQSEMSIIPDKSSDYEEPDPKPVALIGNASIQQGNTVCFHFLETITFLVSFVEERKLCGNPSYKTENL